MSRKEVEGERFMVAFGVDQTPVGRSTFLQVWEQPHNEKDGCFLSIHNRGVFFEEDILEGMKGLFRDPEWSLSYLRDLQYHFERALNLGVYPNIDEDSVYEIAQLFGVKVNKNEVYRFFEE